MVKKTKIFAILLIFCASIFSISCDQKSKTDPQSPIVDDISITGNIIFNEIGLDGVEVSIVNNDNGIILSSITDINGDFTLPLTAGTYTVTPAKGNYTFLPESKEVEVNAVVGNVDFTASQIIPVDPEDPVDPPAGSFSISGKVLCNGIALADVNIKLENKAINNIVSVTTDGNGFYTRTLIKSTIIVTPTKTNYTFSPVSKEITVDKIITNVDFAASQIIPVDPETPPASVKIVFTGDINLGHLVGDVMLDPALGNGDFGYPFKNVSGYLSSFDLTVGNLESMISDKGKNTKTYLEKIGYGITLRADPRAVDGLKYAGFDIVNLANNHAGDYGFEALEDCLDRLSSAGISTIGAGKSYAEAHSSVIKDIRGTKIAFLGYSNVPMYADVAGTSPTPKWIARGPENDNIVRSGLAWAHDTRFEVYGDFNDMRQDIQKAKTQADIVIVSVHFGWEYDLLPDNGPADNKAQQRLARAAIDAGASMVVGHHPHVVQWLTTESAIENYNGGYIAYSLGNFIFDISSTHPSAPNGEATKGLLLEVIIDNKKITKINQVKTVYYDNIWQAQLAL